MFHSRRHSSFFVSILSLLLFLLFSITTNISPVNAAVISVNSFADDEIADSSCTLREAIIAANTDTAYLGCPQGAGPDTISLPDGMYTLNAQLPIISSEIVLSGTDPATTIIQANDAPNTATYRILEVGSGGTLAVNDIGIRHGKSAGGGGINNLGNLSLLNVILSNNYVDFEGGAVRNLGTLTATNTTFSDNSSGSYGGGIHTSTNSNLNVINSTFLNNSATYGAGISNEGAATFNVDASEFSGNIAWYGGGIHNESIHAITISNTVFSSNQANFFGGGLFNGYNSTIGITNSTFSGNTAVNVGGAILNWSAISLTNVTVYGNNAGVGGGISNDEDVAGPINFTNTIIANSTGGDCLSGTLSITNSHSLIEDGSCSDGATNFLSGDPLLGPLADNGGFTKTHALMAESPAIDAGDCATAPATDQRGVTRPQGPACDIGAFELESFYNYLPLFLQ